MKKIIVLIALFSFGSLNAFSDEACKPVLEKIKASYTKVEFDEVTKFTVKDDKDQILGHLSLSQIYSPIFNSPESHMFNLDLAGNVKTGVAHIITDQGSCILVMATSDSGPGSAHRIGLNTSSNLQITVEAGDTEVLLPNSTLVKE